MGGQRGPAKGQARHVVPRQASEKAEFRRRAILQLGSRFTEAVVKRTKASPVLTQPHSVSVVRRAIVPSIVQRRVLGPQRLVLSEQVTMFCLQLVHFTTIRLTARYARRM